MRFSLTEFHLVTGLPCWIKEDEVPVDFECDWPLLLPDERYKVDDLIAQLKVLDDEESKLRLAMLIVILTIFMLPYGITKYVVPNEYLAIAKKNIHAYPWGKASFDMLVSSIKDEDKKKKKDEDKKKNLTKVDLKGFPMSLHLWLLASVSELEEAYARPDDKSDHFPVCARYLSTFQPTYEQIMSKEKNLEVISVLGDSNEEEDDDDDLMHLLKSDYVFSELDWERGYALVQALVQHQEDQEVEIGDRSADYADVGETQLNAGADAEDNDETQTEDSVDEDEAQALEKDEGLVEGFQQLKVSFQDDEPSASTAIPTTPLKKSRYGRVLRKTTKFSPSGHTKKSQRN